MSITTGPITPSTPDRSICITSAAVARLREVQDIIREQINARRRDEQPYVFNMRTWVRTITHERFKENFPNARRRDGFVHEGFCATAGCIAGTIALQAGWRPWDAYAASLIHPNADDDSQVVPVMDIAADLLGIENHNQALYEFFVPWDYPRSPYWFGLDKASPADAITAIDRFIGAHAIEADPA